MINKINFKKLFLPMVIINAISLIAGVLMLVCFGGKTYAEFTINNLRSSLVVKTFSSFFFLVALTTLYFFFRFKKQGVFFGIFAGISALINALSAFSFAVVFRANLGEILFTVVLACTLLTYITALVFAANIFSLLTSSKKKKKKEDNSAEDTVNSVCQKTLNTVAPIVLSVVFAAVVGFICTLVFGAYALALYALPLILTVINTVLLTLVFMYNVYSKKI